MDERRFVVVASDGLVAVGKCSLANAERDMAGMRSTTPELEPYKIEECVDPDVLERLRKDAERLAHVAKYNWIGAKTRCAHKIEDGNLESARAAIDTAMRAEKGDGNGN